MREHRSLRQFRPQKKPTLMLIAPFNNPHIVPFYEQVALSEKFDSTRVSLKPISNDRKRLGWKEMENNNHWLQPWRSIQERFKYYKRLITADIVVFPGFFHTRFLPFDHLIRRVTLRKTLLWSEPFLDHPRSKQESKFKRLLRRVILTPFNTSKYYFLAMGAGAESDYRKIGMSRWNYRQFLFTVQTNPKPTESIVTAKDGVRKIVFSGSLTHRKGVDLLMKAVSLISKEKTPYHLTILGDGPMRQQLEIMTVELGIHDSVSFIGAKPIDEVRDILLQQDLLVLPSRFDGWGAVVNEAMECSLAVITSDQVGARRPLIVEGHNGYVFKSDSYFDLHKKIQLAISDLQELTQMKTNSRKHIEKYSCHSVARDFLNFCDALNSGDLFTPSSEVLKTV